MTSLIKRLDRLSSIKSRRKGIDDVGLVPCFICGEKTHWLTADAAHFISRENMAVRFDQRNIHPVHRHCHAAPSHSEDYRRRMVEVYGEQAVDQLTRDAQKVRKYSQAELEEMILALEKELA